jgi:RNA polymerase sigma factor (sigma-70 family)
MRVGAKVQELRLLIIKAQNGDLGAYDQLVRQSQDMAVAYAYSVLSDFHLAEDAAQEAFVEAFLCLPKLQEPLAFPGWLRRIVFKHCDRLTRNKKVFTVPLEAAIEAVSLDSEPHRVIEKQETALHVRKAIAALSQHERDVTVLFYMGEHSQNQIAEFLEVPVTTVKKRLHTARKKLKEKMIHMVQENLESQRPSRNAEFAQSVRLFIVQFSQMIDAGKSIVRSLSELAEQEQNAELRQAIIQTQIDVMGNGREGTTLSQAMSKHSDVFSQTYIDAIKHGEVNGNLAVVLQRLGCVL